jgi:hypothetical protein
MYQADTSRAFISDKEIIVSDKIYNEGMKPKLDDLITRHGDEIYSLPVFNKKYVDMVMDEIQNINAWGYFVPNKDEHKEAQIDEFVLNNMCPEWYMALLFNVVRDLNLAFYYLFGKPVKSGTIQLANYNHGKIDKTSWHHDKDSDITMVVPLNTGGYEGGGTDFYNRPSIKPLPNGSGLIFPAFGHVHRGAEVHSGSRYLLVFWLKV